MDENILKRVMEISEKTGDRVIVVNEKSGTAHAVVPFDDYEKLVTGAASLCDLSESEDVAGRLEDDEISGSEFDRLVNEIDKEVAEEIRTEVPKEALKKEEIAEINKKIAEQSQLIAQNPAPLDILDDEANEEEYYLEPLE